MIVGVLDFRLRNLDFILLAIEDSEGFLNGEVTQPSLRFWSKILTEGYGC